MSLFELSDTVFLSTGSKPGMIFISPSSGDTISTHYNIGGGYALRTPDGGFLMSYRKISANFEVEWVVPYTEIDLAGVIGGITPYPDSSGSIWFYTGMSDGIYWGDFTSQLGQYPCFWGVNADGTHSSSATILANFTETVSWINWGVDGSGGDNDLIPKIGEDGLKVLANCNTHPCLIDVPFPASPPYSKICYNAYRLTSLIHASDLSGYVMAGGGGGGDAVIIKTNLSGNQQWIKYYGSGYIYGYIFDEVIATTDGGYIAVGQGGIHDDIFVVKTDINGNLQWQIKGLGFDSVIPANYNSTYEMATAVIQTSDGGYLVGGHVDGEHPSGSGAPYPYFSHPFFLKIDSTGNCRPAAGFTHSVADYNLSITANTSFGADSYLWQFGNGDTSNLAMPAYTYPAPGSYNLCLIARNLCGNDTLCTVLDIATGVGQPTTGGLPTLRIYPNPVQSGGGAFWQVSSLPASGAAVLQVYNNMGQLVYSCGIALGNTQGALPSAQWQAGVYVVQIVTPAQTISNKLVVTH